MPAADPYDQVRYPSHAFPQTHPDRLATAGRLAGMASAAPDACRYLEIGCGTGSNLIGMAATLPGSDFLGVDLAGEPIAEATAAALALGLTNLRFLRLDVREFPRELSGFDFIVAHGVYSWVPAPVREAILRLCHERLTPHGIAYISYNAYPGCHVREMLRRMMRYHTRALDDPAQQVSQGRALIQFIAGAGTGPDWYAPLLAKELPHLVDDDPGLVFHDDLAPVNQPFYLHEFVADAARHGMQFLGEANLHEMQDKAYPAAVLAALEQLDDLVQKEQYLDFLKCRRFRQTLLCRAAVALSRHDAAIRAIPTLRYATDAAISESPAATATAVPPLATFTRSNKAVLSARTPVAKAAIEILAQAWPRTRSYVGLRDELRKLLGDGQVTEAELARVLLDTVGVGLVDARVTEVPCVAEPGPRPTASRLARWQAQRGEVITTLRHTSIRVEDGLVRFLLGLLDGVDDRAAIAAKLLAAISDGRVPRPAGVPAETEAIASAIAERLPHLLRHAARLALLSG